MAAPQPPVCRLTKLGTLPAAILRPSSWPLIPVPSRNCACVHTEATVVISLMTTVPIGVFPSTERNATAGLLPLPLTSPPSAVRYSMTSVIDASLLIRNRPSLSVLVCASCEGSVALAPQRVTVDFASGSPPAWTCPSKRTAAAAGPNTQTRTLNVSSKETVCALTTLNIWILGLASCSDPPPGRVSPLEGPKRTRTGQSTLPMPGNKPVGQ